MQNGEHIWRPLRYIRSLGALFVCIMGIASVYIGQIDTPDRGGVKIIGYIPSGATCGAANAELVHSC